MRSESQQSESSNAIEKVVFMEYCRLPGIVSERFYALAVKGSPKSDIIQEKGFTDLLLTVFSSSIEQRMALVFKL